MNIFVLFTMKFPTYLILPVLLGLSNAVNIDTLFNTKATGPGSLGANKAIVQSWLDDTVLLVDAALAGANAYETDPNVRNNLFAYFGIRPTKLGKVYKADADRLTQVQSK